MSTIHQIEANRLNAQKSTGPRSVEGKESASQNALKSGIDAKSMIIRGEHLADFEALSAEYHQRFQPLFPEERHQVDNMVAAEWLLRRLRKAESEIWESEFQDFDRRTFKNTDVPLSEAFNGESKEMDRLQRRLDSLQRSHQRALEALHRLRSARFQPAPHPEAPAAPEPAPEPISISPSVPTKIGFVPSESPVPEVPGGPAGPVPAALQGGGFSPRIAS